MFISHNKRLFFKSGAVPKPSPSIHALIFLLLLLHLPGCGGGSSAPAPSAPASKIFSIVALPDTQIYSHQYPAIFTAQTQWIADNAGALNIKFVLHEGDIVNLPAPGDRQWNNASRAMRILDDAGIPYALAVGNHDYQDHAATRDSSGFNRAFPVSRYSARPWFGGTVEPGKMDNAFHTFTAGGSKWLVMALEYGPRHGAIEWANNIISGHPDHNAIILTHAFVDYDGSLIGQKASHPTPHNDGIHSQPGGAADGVQLWNWLIRHHGNIRMVVSGHISPPGVARRVDTGDHGNRILSMAANYQHEENGGGGFLRIITVGPDAGTATVRTYSPTMNAHKTDPQNAFTANWK